MLSPCTPAIPYDVPYILLRFTQASPLYLIYLVTTHSTSPPAIHPGDIHVCLFPAQVGERVRHRLANTIKKRSFEDAMP